MKRLTAAVTVILALSSPLFAQIDSAAKPPINNGIPVPSTYGGAGETSIVVTAAAFTPWVSASAWETNNFGEKYATGVGFPSDLFSASVNLPNGALITGAQLTGCDTNATNGMLFGIVSTGIDAAASFEFFLNGFTTGAPGCAHFRINPTSARQVDNVNRHYSFLVYTQGAGSSTRFGSVRVFYKLQVSPSPAIAKFTDVPIDDPLNKFVEALYAAGISAGCGDGTTFCPDAPLTRGQMAVFLSAALGLHFPN